MVDTHVCRGCGIDVTTPQEPIAVASRYERVRYCPHCHRILAPIHQQPLHEEVTHG